MDVNFVVPLIEGNASGSPGPPKSHHPFDLMQEKTRTRLVAPWCGFDVPMRRRMKGKGTS